MTDRHIGGRGEEGSTDRATTISWLPNRAILRAGEMPRSLHVLKEGWAIRTVGSVNGKFPIISFLLPGDVFDVVHFITGGPSLHGIRALSACLTEVYPFENAVALSAASPELYTLCQRQAVAHLSRLYARIASCGRRDARERVVQLLLEFHERLRDVGLVEEDSFDCPVRQSQFADALGLTTVHVNRVMKQLQHEGLIEVEERRFRLIDLAELRRSLEEH